jgi:type I restriction enzyme S subunit
VRLGDLVGIKHGWPFKSDLFSEDLTGRPIVVAVGNFQYTGGFRFDSTNVKEYLGEYPADYDLSPGDVLLVMTCQTSGGEILGIPARVPNDGRRYLHNQRLGKVVVKQPKRVSLDYLYWLFLWKDFNTELVASSSGTKIVHTAPTRIEAFRFDLPPLSEQRAIARVLGGLDDKIELNRRMNRTLEDLARGVFRSWFVDFDPVLRPAPGPPSRPPAPPPVPPARRGGPASPAPRSAPAAPAPPHAPWPTRLTDSPLGPIPEGWRVGTVGEIGTNPRRGVLPSEVDATTPYIGLEHMPRRCIALDDWGTAADVSSGKSRFARGEILFGKLRPYFHKVGVALIDGVCSTDVIVAAPKKECWFGVLLGHLSSDEFIDYVDGASGGTRMPRTSWGDMARYQIVIPPEPIAASYSVWMRQVADMLRIHAHESRALAALRDAILPQLLSGEIRLREADRAVDAALRSTGTSTPPARPARPGAGTVHAGAKARA